MQKLMGYMRKAITEYNMIADGDRVAVGVSGGKDSVALLTALVRMKAFLGIDYTVIAITLDPGFGGALGDYSAISKLCKELDVEYIFKRTMIGQVIFDIRKEENPCSLCARMRRGVLHDTAKEAHCNKLALGHHYDDAVETFVMNLFNEGRIGCFSPVTYMSRKDITVIRPMIFATEKDIRHTVRVEELPVVKSVCPVDGVTKRQWTKEFLREMEKKDRGFTNRLFGAMKRGHVDGW